MTAVAEKAVLTDIAAARTAVGRTLRQARRREVEVRSREALTFDPIELALHADVQMDGQLVHMLWELCVVTTNWPAVNIKVVLHYEPSELAQRLRDRTLWVAGLRQELRDEALAGRLRLEPPLPPL